LVTAIRWDRCYFAPCTILHTPQIRSTSILLKDFWLGRSLQFAETGTVRLSDQRYANLRPLILPRRAKTLRLDENVATVVSPMKPLQIRHRLAIFLNQRDL
jgi:hypothetical protein